jgi:hypothetical protein
LFDRAALLVAAGEAALAEVERRRLARVERISMVTEPAGPTGPAEGGER